MADEPTPDELRGQLPRLVAAAISVELTAHRGRERERIVFSVPAPGRHHDVLRAMTAVGMNAARHGTPDNQGFLTSEGRFLGREGAYHLARDNGQLKAAKGEHSLRQLFSEDLW